MRGRRAVRPLTAVVLAAAAVLSATGCALVTDAGTAVSIDGTAVSVQRLQELTNELVDAGYAVDPQSQAALPAGVAQRQVLGVLVTSRVVEQLAREVGVAATKGDVDARFAEFVQSTGSEEALEQGLGSQRGVPPSYARAYVRDLILAERVQQVLVPGDDADPEVADQRAQALSEGLVRVGRQLDIDMNPRYGTWSPTTGQVAPLLSGGLAVPEDLAGAAADETPPAQP